MGDQDFSNKYEGMDLCTISDVEDEIGPVLSKQSSTVFPDSRRDQIIGRWCEREQSKFYQFVGVRFSDLTGPFMDLARDAVLFRVVNRVLKKIQSNRTQRSGGVPSYQELIETYQKEQDMIELHLRASFFPDGKVRNAEYPLSFSVTVKVVDGVTTDVIPGCRVYVDNQWVSTTWKDGQVTFPLPAEDDREYDVVVKAVGYEDSETQTIDEAGTLTFQLEAE
jgi:hypothetical protein